MNGREKVARAVPIKLEFNERRFTWVLIDPEMMKNKKPSSKVKLPPQNDIKAFLDDVESGKIEGSYGLPKNATHLDRLKYSLCRDFVRYLSTEGLTQRDLARDLGVNEARVSEIVNYKIWLLSADALIDLHSKIYPEVTGIRFA